MYSTSLQATRVTVIGEGFVPSRWARCILLSSNPLLLPDVWMPVEYLNRTSVVCHQPRLHRPTFPGSRLGYAHDGQLISERTIPYVAVAIVQGVEVSSTEAHQALIVQSSEATNVPRIDVFTVDENGNRVRNFDEASRVFRITIMDANSFPVEFYYHSSAPINDNTTMSRAQATSAYYSHTSRGHSIASNLVVVNPLEMRFTIVVGLGDFFGTVTYVVVPGQPAKLSLVARQRSYSSMPSSPWVIGVLSSMVLLPAPTITVTDAATNHVRSGAVLPTVVHATYTKNVMRSLQDTTIDTFTVQLQATLNGDYEYVFSMEAQGLFGVDKTITFYVTDQGVPNTHTSIAPVRIVLSDHQKCPSDKLYAVPSQQLCTACPPHGMCDGTANVEVEPGFWRGSLRAYTFYDCRNPYGADACVTSRECLPGYQGPRCSVCAPGYGKVGLKCQQCSAATTNIVLLALVGVVILIVVVVLVSNSVGDTRRVGAKKSVLPILVKLLLTHFQITAMASNLDAAVPPFLKSYMASTGSASTFDPNLSFLTCLVNDDFRNVFLVVCISPVALILFCVLFGAVRSWRALNLNEQLSRKNQLEQENANRLKKYRSLFSFSRKSLFPSEDTDPQFDQEYLCWNSRVGVWLSKWIDNVMVSILVVVFLMYPSVLDVCFKMLRCEEFDMGPTGGTVSVLFEDRKLSCNDPSYTSYRNLALMVLALFGLGSPALFVGLVTLATHLKEDAAVARQLFFFTTGGFQDRFWFWEAVTLLRKTALLASTSVISNSVLRSYVSTWILLVVLVINIWAHPWANETLSRLENLSLTSLSVTYSLLMAIPQLPELLTTAAAILILVINISTLLIFAQAMSNAVILLIRDLHASNPQRFSFLAAVIDFFKQRTWMATQFEIEKLKDLKVKALRLLKAPRFSRFDSSRRIAASEMRALATLFVLQRNRRSPSRNLGGASTAEEDISTALRASRDVLASKKFLEIRSLLHPGTERETLDLVMLLGHYLHLNDLALKIMLGTEAPPAEQFSPSLNESPMRVTHFISPTPIESLSPIARGTSISGGRRGTPQELVRSITDADQISVPLRMSLNRQQLKVLRAFSPEDEIIRHLGISRTYSLEHPLEVVYYAEYHILRLSLVLAKRRVEQDMCLFDFS